MARQKSSREPPQPHRRLTAGLEPGDDGYPVGRDPRRLRTIELRKAGHEPASLLAVVRTKCSDCCGGALGEVRLCTAVDCALWPYRMGTKPLAPKTERGAKAAARRRAGAGR